MVNNGRRGWSYTTTHTKNISFQEHDIYTTITKDPNSVTAWISTTTENINSHHPPLIGLDIQWRPSYRRGVENRVAILQLCSGHRCLIFQIIHSPYIPQSLTDFLNNPTYTFTGAGIHDDVEKLVRHYGLRLGANVVDLGWLAAQLYGEHMHVLGLKSLATVVLGKEPEMLTSFVMVSRWDDRWLLSEQMEYASVGGFLSFEIGRVLVFMGASLYIT